jgi:DNA repair exonuclease SbcCD ATPase subunit
MRNLKFHYARAKNFLCFGPDGIELKFSDYGSVVEVVGVNLDTGTDAVPASNGAGKSSLQDIISYCLYGKCVKKKQDHSTVINTVNRGKLEVEVQFDDYRVLRGREPNKLKLWHSKDRIWDENSEITKGTMAETQKEIERIIGLSHTAFCNVVVFDDSNAYSFLELDANGKRTVVENLLGLDRYREYLENTKDELKGAKEKIKELTKDYENSQNEIDAIAARIKKVEEQEVAWRKTKNYEISTLIKQITEKQNQLEAATDGGAALITYEAEQAKLPELEANVEKYEVAKTKLVALLEKARPTLETARSGRDDLQTEMSKLIAENKALEVELNNSKDKIIKLEGLEAGERCGVCHGLISIENYGSVLAHERNCVSAAEAKINKNRSVIAELKKQFDEKVSQVQKITAGIGEAEQRLNGINIELEKVRRKIGQINSMVRPDTGAASARLETEISGLKKQLKAKQDEVSGGSPYAEIITRYKDDIHNQEEISKQKGMELKTAEEEIPYLEYWYEAFGDKGIRRYVVDGIIPSLNSRIAYCMQYLIDSKIEVNFDNELNEDIKRNGNKAYYYAMSNGEKRRINLAVSQAFAYVMTLNSGACPSLVFLDEITGGGIDRAGVTGVYNLIFELAKERQVFITTHNQNLLDMLSGCDTIKLVKKDDITKLSA